MEVGEIVEGPRGRYQIDKKLGEGYTSEVYRALPLKEGASPVALKVLRPNVDRKVEQNFFLEGEILSALAQAEAKESRNDSSDGSASFTPGTAPSSVPRIVDTQWDGETRFLALELVTGTPLDELMEREVVLPEREVLAVAEQVLRVLDLLHRRLRRTYTDFQFKNIWIERQPEATPRVKVMDWNHVSDQAAEELPNGFGSEDLARMGVYLYRMLTGKGASVYGETEHDLEQRGRKHWEELSLSTRRLVLKALHPSPVRRFRSAAEFRQAVLAVQELWNRDEADLYGDVREVLEQLEITEAPEERQELLDARGKAIEEALDMLRRFKDPELAAEQLPDYERRWKAYVGEESLALAQGRGFYRAEQYPTAAKHWRAEAEAQGRASVWRWVLVADAMAALEKPQHAVVRPALEHAVAALEGQEPKKAVIQLDPLPVPTRYLPPIIALLGEAQARAAVEEASRLAHAPDVLGWERAAQLLAEAERHLGSIPEEYKAYRNSIQAEQDWLDDQGQLVLAQGAKELSQRAKLRRQGSELEGTVEHLLRAGGVKEAAWKLEEGLRADPSNEAVVALSEHAARNLLKDGRPDAAVSMLAPTILYAARDLADRRRELWLNALNEAGLAREAQVEAQKRAAEEEAAKRRLEQVKQDTEKRAQSRREELAQMAAQVRQAFEAHEWQKVHFLVTKKITPDDVKGSTGADTWGELRKSIDKRYTRAMEAREQVLAGLLFEVLEVLEPDAHQDRRERFESLTSQLSKERETWISTTLTAIQSRILNVNSSQEIEELLSQLEETARLLSPDDALKYQAEIEPMQTALMRKRDSTRLTEALETGRGLLRQLTRDGIAQARKRFSEAAEFEGGQLQVTDALKASKELEQDVLPLVERARQNLALAQGVVGSDRGEKLVVVEQDLDDAEARANNIWSSTWIDTRLQSFEVLDRLKEEANAARAEQRGGRVRRLIPRLLAGLLALALLTLGGYTAWRVGQLSDVQSNTGVQATPATPAAAEVQGPTLAEVATAVANLSADLADVNAASSEQDPALRGIQEQLETLNASLVPPPVSSPETPSATAEATATPPFSVADFPDGPLYDLPRVTVQLAEGQTGGVAADDPSSLVISDQDQLVQLLVDGQVQEGTWADEGDGAFTWTPSPNGAPLAPGPHSLALQFGDGSLIEQFTVLAPLSATLEPGAAIRIAPDPGAQEADGVSDRFPEGTVQVVGKWMSTGSSGEAYSLFLAVRPTNVPDRQLFWIAWQNVDGITGQQANELPTIPPAP